ncbi:hypothetical protein KA005_62040, partial [bacterium]|nr:hypothetical protein [bacterium]
RTAEDFDEIVTKRTNDAANAVSLHVSMMVENLQWLGKAFDIVKDATKPATFILGGWVLRLLKGKDATEDLAEAQNKLRDAMLRGIPEGAIEDIKGFEEANKHLKVTIDETLEPIDMMTRATEIFRGKLEELTEFEGIFDALTPPSELMARWEEFYNLVETPELDLIWEQQMSSMEEDTLAFMASIIPGMEFMTKEITDDTKKMAKDYKLTFTDMAVMAGNVLTAMAGKSKALAIAGAVISTYAAAAKTLQTFGWPAAIPFMAAAIAAGLKQVAMIKGQSIPTAEKGAYLPSPAIIEAGHGPLGEVVLPLDRAPLGFTKGGGRGAIGEQGGMTEIHANITINARTLDDRTIADSAEKLAKAVEGELARVRGY